MNNNTYNYDPYTGQPIYQNYNQQKKSSSKLPLIIAVTFVAILLVGVFLFLNKGNKPVSRTVMIYMVGADLESKAGLATVDLDAIEYNKDAKVVLIAGGSKKWHNDYIDSTETSIYELTKNGYKKVKQQSIRSMGNPQTLSDFLSYVYKNYKSDEYILVFWDHGGAIDGSEYDELTSNDKLTLSDLEEALDDSPFSKKNKLELIIFRTCLNGTIEVANVFDGYAKYLVASEEVTRGAGFTNVLGFINNIKSTDSTIDVGKKYIRSYQRQISEIVDKYGTRSGSIYSTYSLIDLSKIQPLIGSINNFFGDISVKSNYNTIAKKRANLYQYGSDAGEDSYDMVDLYNLVSSLADLSPKNAQKVLSNIESAIVFNWATNPESRGLSIYFPYNGVDYVVDYFLNIYDDISELKSYKNFINSFVMSKSSDYTYYNYNTNVVNAENKSEDSDYYSDFSLELTDEQLETFAKATYVVYRDNKDGFYSARYGGGSATLEGNKLKATIRDRQLRVVDLDDPNSGYTLILFEKDNKDDYIKYETYVILEDFRPENISDWKMDQATIELIYDKKTGTIEISNVILDSSDLTSVVSVNLEDYQYVAFSITGGWKILDDNGNYVGPQKDENGRVIGDGTITGWEEEVGKFKFELESFDDGYDYYCVFNIFDTHNNVSYSKLIKMN